MSVRPAWREFMAVAGTQLDPDCGRFTALAPRVLWAIGPVALLVNLLFLRQFADTAGWLSTSR